jgi:succinylglutamate desuccinylase
VHLALTSKQNPDPVRRKSFQTEILLANPKALAQVSRYVDKDLNRCFSQADLQNLSLCSYEDIRAREIENLFGQNGKNPVDAIVDLHTTTANMGLTLITDDLPFNLQLAAYLQEVNPLVNIYILPISTYKFSHLRSICELGCAIEVGAIAQGVLQADLFQQTEALIHNALNFFEQYNRVENLSLERKLTFYQHCGTIDYPRNKSGEIKAVKYLKRVSAS